MPRLPNSNSPSFSFEVPWSFFDGAFQGTPKGRGVGMVIHLSHSNFFQLKLIVGLGTNTTKELISL